jgi:hypothetical protein
MYATNGSENNGRLRSALLKSLKYSQHWLAILMGFLVTPVCFVLGAFLSGGGHSFISMIVLFPYGMFLGMLFGGKLFWFFIGLPLFILQYPLYGLALGVSISNRNLCGCLRYYYLRISP